MKKNSSRFALLLLSSCFLMVNTTKTSESEGGDILMKILYTGASSALAGVCYMGSQTAYQIVVDKYFPSDISQAALRKGENEAEDSVLTSLRVKLDILSKSGLSKEERQVEEARIKEAIQKELKKSKLLEELSEAGKEKIKAKNQSSKSDKDKVGIITKITAPLFAALTKSGELADFLASNSFAHITNLDCFKDTVIAANAQNINRALIVVTAAGLIYGGYKVYDKYRNFDNEDIFDNDED